MCSSATFGELRYFLAFEIRKVYPAGEEPIPGADSRSLTRSIRQRGQVEPVFAEDIEDVPQLLCSIVEAGDVVITQGAGNVGRLAQDLSTIDMLEGAEE